MDRSLGLFAIGLIFGCGIGILVAASNGLTLDGHDHDDPTAHGGMAMDHADMGDGDVAHGGTDHEMMHDTLLDVTGVDAPVLSIALTPDPLAGHNLHVMTKNFTFAPKSASLAHASGEGHAHVYANGVKLGRLYGAWMHIDGLPKGEVTIDVTLNSNDHRPLAANGQPIKASTKVSVE